MIEVPKHCRRLVKAYEKEGYTLVQSDHPRHLLKLELGFSGAPTPSENAQRCVYITMGRSPLSLLSRDGEQSYLHATKVKVPYYTPAERKRALELVFGARK